jgi:hypothetical protein
MDQFDGYRSAAEAARLSSTANAARELHERLTVHSAALRLCEEQRKSIELLAPKLHSAVRRISVEQPLMIEEIKLAFQGNFAAAQLLDVVRTTELNKSPIPEMVARLSQPAFVNPVLEAFRSAAEHYWDGTLDVDAEDGDVLVKHGRKRVVTLSQWSQIVAWILNAYFVADNVHDERVADERWTETQRQFAEIREILDQQHPDYMLAITNLNLRSEPSTQSHKVRVLEPRTILVLLERRGDWLHVELAEDRSQRGWVAQAFVDDLE